MATGSFIRVGEYSLLEESLRSLIDELIAKKRFSKTDVQNIRSRELDLIRQDLTVSDRHLEKLRSLCQLWEIDISDAEIKSHRRFLGPIIVRVKKLLFPIVRFFIKDLIREQRAFNAEAISLLSELAHDVKTKELTGSTK